MTLNRNAPLVKESSNHSSKIVDRSTMGEGVSLSCVFYKTKREKDYSSPMEKSKSQRCVRSLREEDDILCDTPVSEPTSTLCKGKAVASTIGRSPWVILPEQTKSKGRMFPLSRVSR